MAGELGTIGKVEATERYGNDQKSEALPTGNSEKRSESSSRYASQNLPGVDLDRLLNGDFTQNTWLQESGENELLVEEADEILWNASHPTKPYIRALHEKAIELRGPFSRTSEETEKAVLLLTVFYKACDERLLQGLPYLSDQKIEKEKKALKVGFIAALALLTATSGNPFTDEALKDRAEAVLQNPDEPAKPYIAEMKKLACELRTATFREATQVQSDVAVLTTFYVYCREALLYSIRLGMEGAETIEEFEVMKSNLEKGFKDAIQFLDYHKKGALAATALIYALNSLHSLTIGLDYLIGFIPENQGGLIAFTFLNIPFLNPPFPIGTTTLFSDLFIMSADQLSREDAAKLQGTLRIGEGIGMASVLITMFGNRPADTDDENPNKEGYSLNIASLSHSLNLNAVATTGMHLLNSYAPFPQDAGIATVFFAIEDAVMVITLMAYSSHQQAMYELEKDASQVTGGVTTGTNWAFDVNQGDGGSGVNQLFVRILPRMNDHTAHQALSLYEMLLMRELDDIDPVKLGLELPKEVPGPFALMAGAILTLVEANSVWNQPESEDFVDFYKGGRKENGLTLRGQRFIVDLLNRFFTYGTTAGAGSDSLRNSGLTALSVNRSLYYGPQAADVFTQYYLGNGQDIQEMEGITDPFDYGRIGIYIYGLSGTAITGISHTLSLGQNIWGPKNRRKNIGRNIAQITATVGSLVAEREIAKAYINDPNNHVEMEAGKETLRMIDLSALLYAAPFTTIIVRGAIDGITALVKKIKGSHARNQSLAHLDETARHSDEGVVLLPEAFSRQPRSEALFRIGRAEIDKVNFAPIAPDGTPGFGFSISGKIR